MRAEATSLYREHPMGYACRDCGAAAEVGRSIWHSARCDIAPRQWIRPAWPDPDRLVELDARAATGDLAAIGEMEVAIGLRPPVPIGTWTWWRQTEEWAIRIAAKVVPGTPVRVYRRNITSSKEIAGETLWACADYSIVRVRTDDVDEGPCARAFVYSSGLGTVLPEAVVVVSRATPSAPGMAPWSVQQAASATQDESPGWSWATPDFAWSLEEWDDELWTEELDGRPCRLVCDITAAHDLSHFEERIGG